MSLHKNVSAADVHIAQSLVYADDTARLAATGFVAGDVGRLAFVTATKKLWALVGYSPIAWNDLTAMGTATPSAGTLAWGNGGVSATTTTRYLTPSFEDSTAPTSAIQFRCPVAGFLKNLRVRHNTPAGNANSIVYTVRVNGTPSTLAVSMVSTASDGNDLVHSVAVAAGDLIDIAVTKATAIGTSPSNITAILEVSLG